jgi:ATP-binding cassette subfamily B protein
MVLGAHGVRVDLASLRDATRTGREGVSAAGLLQAARRFGLAGKGVRCPVERLGELPGGAVLHWGGNHFVVLERLSRRGLHVLDPGLGRRVVTPETFAEQYSGVALVFTPTADVGGPPQSEQDRGGRWERYRSLLHGARRPALLALALAAAVQVFTLVTPLVLRRVVNSAADPSPDPLSALAAAVTALAAGFLLAQVGRLLCLIALQRVIDVRLTVGVLRHLSSLSYAFLARRSTGDLALRVRSTVIVRQILTSSALSAVLDGTLVLGYLALILAIDPWFAALTAAAVAAQAAVVALTWPRMRQAAAEALEAQTVSQNRLLELVSSLELLKASGAATQAAADWGDRLRREVAAQAASTRLSGLVDSVLLTIRFAAPPALLILGLARLRAGALELGDMLALAALSAAVTVPTGALLSTVCALTSVIGYLERLDDLLQAPPEESGARPVPRRVRGAVRLDAVSFTYSALLPPAIDNVSVAIEPGEHVAVVGASGSGKTTLALLIATLYRPTSGVVLIDGRDAREYDTEQLRRRIGVVTQNTTLFNASIRDNIAFGRSWITDEDVLAATRAAAVHDEIVALPSGYDTLLGNAGAGLSGGQRQRLALARALAARPGLLVLDEATSALDPVTEHVVQRALAGLHCTRIVVAHRTSTISGADRVLVLENGRLVANGSYASVRRRSAEFRALLHADGRLRGAT